MTAPVPNGHPGAAATVKARPLDPALLRARLTGRAWFVLKMMDGRIIPEWSCDWSLAPTKGRQALRLYCPSGEVAEVGLPDGHDASGRLFQFKVGVARAGYSREALAHVIGVIVDPAGTARCASWERDPVGRGGHLVTFVDSAWDLKYHNVGRLSDLHLGLLAP